MRHLSLWLALILLCSGCASPALTQVGGVANTQSAPLTSTPNDAPNLPDASPVGLILDEVALKGEITLDPLTFQPVQGTQDEVMGRHAQARQAPYQRNYDFVDNHTTIYPVNGGKTYRATQIEQKVGSVNEMLVQMEKDGQPILTVKAGPVTPITPLAGLWVDGSGAWVLEIASTANATQDNTVPLDVAGQLYRTGVLLNRVYGYAEMFGYQLLDGEPFYFYKEGGQVHLSYANRALPLVYDDVPHYNCCSSAALNPVSFQNGVRFFGRRAGVWYYTEIGKY